MSRNLKDWESFDNWVSKQTNTNKSRFKSILLKFNRFNARFRAATSGIEVKGYRDESTGDGYSALLKIVLVWSAYEYFLECFDLNQNDSGQLVEKSNATKQQQDIRNLDVGDKFFNFIKSKVNARHKRELESYFDGSPCNLVYLASAIRHAFTHGALTPNVDGVEARIVRDICVMLSETLLRIMDNKFTEFIRKEDSASA